MVLLCFQEIRGYVTNQRVTYVFIDEAVFRCGQLYMLFLQTHTLSVSDCPNCSGLKTSNMCLSLHKLFRHHDLIFGKVQIQA
jgi:hypothetical protein